MILHRLLSAITRQERSKLNENFDRIERSYKGVIDTSNDALGVAKRAESKSDGAVYTAGYAKITADATAQQLETLIVESGTSDAEVIAMRTNRGNGKTYPTAGARLDDEINQITRKSKVSILDYEHLTDAELPIVNRDWTNALTQAIADARVVEFIDIGFDYKVGTIDINSDITLQLNDATLNATSETLFNVIDNIASYEVKDGTFLFDTVGVHSNNLFINGKTDKSVEYNVDKLLISNCTIKNARVMIYGASTIPVIENCKFINESKTPYGDAILKIDKDSSDYKVGKAWIKGCLFDVYPYDSDNIDVLKVSGNLSGVIIEGNIFINRNNNAGAQIDVFTGGHKMRFLNNHLEEVMLNRKQVIGGTALPTPPEIALDLIQGNVFEVKHSINIACINAIGGLFTITDNQFSLTSDADTKYAIRLANSDVVYDDTFNTTRPVAFVISNNVADIRNGVTSAFLYVSSGASTLDNFGIISGNVCVGAFRFVQNSPSNLSFSNNIWLTLGREIASNGFVNGGNRGNVIAHGNLTDSVSDTSFYTKQGNAFNQTIANIAMGSAIDADRSEIARIDGGITITSITGGHKGQRLTIYGVGIGATVNHNTNIRLNNASDYTLGLRDTLVLLKNHENIWVEVSRSKNTV